MRCLAAAAHHTALWVVVMAAILAFISVAGPHSASGHKPMQALVNVVSRLTDLGYQASGFCRKHGYEAIASISGCPDGISRHLMLKAGARSRAPRQTPRRALICHGLSPRIACRRQ